MGNHLFVPWGNNFPILFFFCDDLVANLSHSQGHNAHSTYPQKITQGSSDFVKSLTQLKSNDDNNIGYYFFTYGSSIPTEVFKQRRDSKNFLEGLYQPFSPKSCNRRQTGWSYYTSSENVSRIRLKVYAANYHAYSLNDASYLGSYAGEMHFKVFSKNDTKRLITKGNLD